MSQWLHGGDDIYSGHGSRSFQAEKDVEGIQTEKVAGAKLWEGEGNGIVGVAGPRLPRGGV